MEITLSSGERITLRDPETIRHRDRKKLFAGIEEGMNQFERGFAMTENLLALAVTDWSFDLLPPAVRRESLDDLLPAQYDELAEAIKPFLDKLMPGAGAADDPKVSPGN